MKSRTVLQGFALALVALMAAGSASAASPRGRNHHSFEGVWRLDSRQDQYGLREAVRDRTQERDRGRSSGWDRRDGNRWGRDDESFGSNRGRGMGARLPASFQIDRERRAFRLETLDGRLLREIDVARGNRLQDRHTGRNGATIVDTYTLANGGRHLTVHTVVRGPRGTREFTRVYERA